MQKNKPSKLRKLQKKRRAELERRRQKAEPLAYHGNKYKTDALVPVVFETEAGLYESFVMSERRMTDHDARAAVESLIRGIRGGTIPLPPQLEPADRAATAGKESLPVWNIRRHWEEYFSRAPFPGRDNLIGVLRTILGSMEVWGNMSPTSRGYLRYIEGFMAKLGVHCQQVPPDFFSPGFEADAADDEEFAEGESELLAAGRAWCHDGNADAGVVFRAMTKEMIAAGEAGEVAETCQQLMGEISDRRMIDELSALSISAQRTLKPAPFALANAVRGVVGRWLPARR
jgi:hypothetical protein